MNSLHNGENSIGINQQLPTNFFNSLPEQNTERSKIPMEQSPGRQVNLYRGNAIFRQQPPFTHFNKPADDPEDILNQELNEINPAFLCKNQLEHEAQSTQVWEPFVDPRTNQTQKKFEIDHTSWRKRHKIFYGGGIKSSLTKYQHIVCLRVLCAWQNYEEVNEEDIVIYRGLKVRIEKEQEEMRTYLNEYAEHHKDKIYAPAKRLDALYKNWFKQTTNQLLKQHPENVAFNTHTGLPHVIICKNVNNENVEIEDVKLVANPGCVRLHKSEYDWQNLNLKLNCYAGDYNNDQINKKTMFEKKLKAELKEFNERVDGRNFFIPFETILFLLTAGDYVDLPTEVLLEIRNGLTEDEKIVVFDDPLPARNCGWHTQQQVIDQAFTEFVAAKGRCKWINFDEEKVNSEPIEACEINGILDKPMKFAPLTLEEYIAKNKTKYEKFETEKRRNEALVEWHLKINDLHSDLKILTTLTLPPAMDVNLSEFLPHESLKLEYKPEFGCELMSKYELLRAWLKMKLMSFTKRSDQGICYRLSLHDCELQLAEHLTLENIELRLQKDYFVNAKKLISNLAEFLKLLSNMTTGKYLLRYNAKYKDKLLLCSPAQEITQNTVFLHSLLNTEPTNVAFMTQHYFLTINESLCSVVHLDHKVMPCAFLPKERHQKNLEYFSTRMQKKKTFFNKAESDRNCEKTRNNVISKNVMNSKKNS